MSLQWVSADEAALPMILMRKGEGEFMPGRNWGGDAIGPKSSERAGQIVCIGPISIQA